MKNRLLNLATVLLIAGLGITGCKEDTIIKASTTPASDNIFSNAIGDTLTIYSKTVEDDSVATGFTSSTFNVIHAAGTLTDAFFGRTNWGIYIQVLPNAANLTLPVTPDSAVLILPYSGFTWGDTSATGATTEEFVVYRVTEDMSKDTAYFSKTRKSVDWSNPVSDPIAVNLYKLKDSVKVAGANRAPHMRLKLKGTFLTELINTAKNASTSAAFLTAIKGLYIGVKDTNNNTIKRIPYFFISGSDDYLRASVALYYSENGNTKPDSIKTNFLNFTTADCAHYNYVSRKYDGYPAYPFVKRTTGLVSDSIMLMQNEPGAAFDIRIPYLKNLPASIINKAQLVITKVSVAGDPEGSTLFEPNKLYPIGVDASGKSYTILDREPAEQSAPLDFIDGTKRSVTVNGLTVTQWYINIPREVQKTIINKTDELHLRINGTVTYPGAYRLIAGGKHSSYSVRLNITYSKIN